MFCDLFAMVLIRSCVICHGLKKSHMEETGLAIGAVDVFSYISAARLPGNNCEILETMLDIQKLLLLQWAEGVRLLYNEHDARLDDPVTHDIISKTLHRIHLLLSNGSDMQQRYAVDKVDDAQRLPASRSTISRPRMQSFLRRFEELKIVIGKSPKETSATKKFWVIWDKTKFETLIGQLSALVSGLNSPCSSSQRSYG